MQLNRQGDTNRVVAETTMNACSTRSHCIFFVDLEYRNSTTPIIRKSRLSLVDLAGSERLGKSPTDSLVFTEGRSINLSLHFLEQVIVALNDRRTGDRKHIPYRNSVLTSVLRDSFGGNCKTSMIATLSCNQKWLDETICTCRFAQRVGLLDNVVRVNELEDPSKQIELLKVENQRLKEEISLLRGSGDNEILSSEDLSGLKSKVEGFLHSADRDSDLVCGSIGRV